MSLLFIRINNVLEQNRYLAKGLVKNYLILLTLFLLAFFSINYILSVSANNSNGIIKIYPSADSWVNSSAGDTNYGSDTILHVRNMTDNTKRQTFLRFNLSEMPPGTIISATLNLYSMSSSDSRLVFLGVYLVDNDSWVEGNGSSSGCYANDTGTCGAPPGEYAIRWNNKPVIGQLLNVTKVGKNKWASWNVTNAVITEYSNDKTINLALTFSAKHPYHRKDFYSSEYPNGNYTPFLNILYIPMPVTTTTTTSTTTTSTTTTTTEPTTTTTEPTTTTTIETTTTTTIPETTTTTEPTTTTTTEPTTTTIETTTTTTIPETTTTTEPTTTTTTEPTTTTIETTTTTTIPETTTTTEPTTTTTIETTTTTTIPETTTTTEPTTTSIITTTTTTSITTTTINTPPIVLPGYVNYTGSTSSGESITFWCNVTDPDQDVSTLNVRLWIGTCNPSDCFTTRDWSDLPGLNNRQMTWDSGSGMFKYEWTIPWSAGTTVAGTCYAIDDQSAGSNWGDKYPFFTVTSPPTTTTSTTTTSTTTSTTTTTIPITIPIVENSTTQNTTFCNNVTITIQAWDPEGIDTVILYDTQVFDQYDFGIPTSPVETGFINVTIYTLYTPSQGYGWATSPIDGRDRGFGTALTRDLIFDSVDREFKVDIPNGTYDVTVYLGDMSYAHDNMDVTAEGTFLADNENTFAGEVKSFSSEVIVSDGQSNVIFHDDGGINPHWTSNGLIIKQASSYVMEHVSGNNYTVSFHPNPGKHDVRFIVNDTLGYVNDTVTGSYYVYSPPSITSVDVTPDYPKTNDVLSCIPIGWYDPDGDLPQYYYQWYDDNSIIIGATSSTYNCSSSGCDKGDTITCVVIPYDTYQNGTAVNGSEIIENTGHTLTNISTDKTCVKLNTVVNVTTINAFDADSDSLILRVSSSPKLYDLCNSSSAQPEISCTFNTPWNDTNVHTVYGLVDDGLETSDEKSTAIQTDNSGPNAPTGLNPINGFKTNNNTPTFSWLVTTDLGCNGIVNKYQVSVYMDSSCSILNRTKQLSTTSYTFPDPFPDGTYYWRVKARDGLSNWGNWSDCIQLIIDTKPPVVENSTTENVTEGQDEHETVDVWDENGVSSVYVEIFEEYLKFDFQIPSSPVEPGFINITKDMLYNSSVGYGWTSSPSGDRDRGIGSALERDFIFDSINRTFNIDLSNGDYFVTVFLGDMSYAHDDVDVYAEGILKLDDVNTSAGEIKRLSFLVPVSDGQLNILFNDSGGSDPNWVCVGLIVSSMNQTYLMNYVSGNKYTVTIPSPSIGINHKRYVATDNAGNVNNLVIDWFYVNAKPSIVSVNITPNNPKTNDILNCTPYGWYDPDGDSEGYYYQWYDDGLLIVNATNSTYNCSNPGCDKGNVIYCEVTPYDSHQNGTAVNGSVIIGNSPPSKPKLSPETGTFHNIVYINCSGSTDPDGDSITYNIQTDVNGTWKDIVVNDSDGYYEWDISGYPCKNGVDLRCRAFDGINYSSWENPPSKKINIDNCGPIVTFVDPTPANGSRNINNWIFVNAIAVDNQSDVDTCILEWNGINETMNKSTYDLIVDDGDTGYTDTGWAYATGQGYGNDVHYIINGTGSQIATWTPSLPVAENYSVYVSWTTHPNRATDAPYTVYYSGGAYNFTINQERLADQNTTGASGQWSGWYYVGKFYFNTGNITLNNKANEYVIADAVKFSIETCGLNKTTVDCVTYTYKVYANDTLGNEGNSSTRNNKENKKPSVPVLLSPPNATITNHVITLYDWINSTDEENDTITYDLLIDNDSGFISPLITKIGLPDSNYILNLTELALLNNSGIYYWKVRAFDGYEYSSYSSFWMFSIDLTPPRVENSSVMNITECNDLNITVDAWDENNISTVIVQDISVINQSYQMNNIGNNTYRVTIHPCRGNHTIRYYANDTLGNLNDSVTDWFNVTPTTPRVVSVMITPSIIFNNSIYVGTGNIQFNITFNKPMNASIPLSVTYGNVTPYNSFKVIGNWTSSKKTWFGYSSVNSSTPIDNYTLNISGGMDQSCNSLFAGQMMVENTSTWFIIDTNMPRVISVVINSSVANNITCVKEGNITFIITFGPNMNTSVNPIVTFGRFPPYNTYVVNGSWFANTTWVGYFNITSSMTNAWYTLSISGAKDLLGRNMTTDTSYGFNVDTMPPMIRDIFTSNITKEENETVTIEVKDYDCVGYESCGLDTVLMELNGSVNFTMELGYYNSLIGYYMYYYNITNNSYGVGNQSLRFFVNDTAGNVNSNSTAFFYVNGTIPKIGGTIAFLCKNNPSGSMCNDDIEDELISWLRSQGWTVDVNTYYKWNKTVLSGYDLIMCSDEMYACDYGTNNMNDVYYMHKTMKKPFVEISDDGSLRAATNFGYVSYPGGYIRNNVNSLYVTTSHPITIGYFGSTRIFDTNKTMAYTTDIMLNNVRDIADIEVENRRSTLFSNDQPGRFVYVGWFYNDFSGLNKIGNTTLARAINWAQCENAKGCVFI